MANRKVQVLTPWLEHYSLLSSIYYTEKIINKTVHIDFQEHVFQFLSPTEYLYWLVWLLTSRQHFLIKLELKRSTNFFKTFKTASLILCFFRIIKIELWWIKFSSFNLKKKWSFWMSIGIRLIPCTYWCPWFGPWSKAKRSKCLTIQCSRHRIQIESNAYWTLSLRSYSEFSFCSDCIKFYCSLCFSYNLENTTVASDS